MTPSEVNQVFQCMREWRIYESWMVGLASQRIVSEVEGHQEIQFDLVRPTDRLPS
jgi:hypothetical protein